MTSAAPTFTNLSPLLPSSPVGERFPRTPASAGHVRKQRKSGSRRAFQLALLGLAALGHLGALAFVVYLSQRPVEIPRVSTIAVALIAAEPLADPTPEPAPESVPEPRIEPPPPEVVNKTPPPQVKPAPRPRPVPKPKPVPVVKQTDSPTALQQPAAEVEEVADSAPPAAEARPPAPAQPSRPAAAAPVRTTEARYDAAYLNNPAPTYPAVSRRLREEGQVMLRVLVSTEGQPKNIELRTSSGSDRLDKAAIAAVSRWRFVAAQRGDQAIEAWVLVPIVFKLTGN